MTSNAVLSEEAIFAATRTLPFSPRHQQLIRIHLAECRKEYSLSMEVVYQDSPDEWCERGVLRIRPVLGSPELIMLANCLVSTDFLGRRKTCIFCFYSAQGEGWLPIGAYAQLKTALEVTRRMYRRDDRFKEGGFRGSLKRVGFRRVRPLL